MISTSMFENFHNFRKIRRNVPILWDFSNPFPFQNKNGRIYLWTSSQAYQKYKEKIASSLWWIDLPSFPISFPFQPHTLQHRWLIYSFDIFSYYIGYLRGLSVIRILSLWAFSGKHYSN